MRDAKHISEASRLLASFVAVDPESLPIRTAPNYTFRYIDIASANQGRLLLPDDEIEYRDAPSRARRVLRDQDVIMSTVRPNLRAFAYCRLPPGNFVASTGFAVLRAKQLTDPRFILYSILSDDVTRQIERLVVGSNYPAISSSDVKRLRIPNLSPGEQARIGEIIGTVDEAIEQTEALIAKTQQIKAGLMRDLFTRGATAHGQLRPPREEAPQLYKESPLGWVPKEWEVVPVGDLLARVEQGWSPDCESEPARNNEWGVLKTTAVQWSGFWPDQNKRLPEQREARTKLAIRRDDVLMTRAGPNSRVGVVTLVDVSPGKVMLSDKLYRLVPAPSVEAAFLALALGSESSQRHLSQFKTGLAESQTNISQAIVRRLLLPLPQEDERLGIVGRVMSAQNAIRRFEAELLKLHAIKSGLMSDLLTRRVPLDTFIADEADV